MNPWTALLLALIPCIAPFMDAAPYRNPYGRLPAPPTPGDLQFSNYFRIETEKLAGQCLADIRTPDDWARAHPRMRRELFEMLGLDPLPPRTDLNPVITGTLEEPEFTVEKLYFQSMPGLYVTASFYLPKRRTGPVPGILYVCGHSPVKTNGISYGNKSAYQHHGIWFARHGYACLTLDTVEHGEIEGRHHGTSRDGMWWWNSRGYTPAGTEAWNGIRALDYLETRMEVDSARIGVTGRSGGGAYSWWIAALDDRIKAACPVAGITDLQNHVVDGVVEGHCDCMFMVNILRWDYAAVAALVAPRPLLICNTDKDTIFPLDGVTRLHERVRRIYDLNEAGDRLGLLIAEGPHRDTQELQVPVLRWFNRHLKKEESLVEVAASKRFSGQQLKVFDSLPANEITSRCYEHLPQVATNTHRLDANATLEALRTKTFGGWPNVPAAPARQIAGAESDGVRLTIHEFESQPGMRIRYYMARAAGFEPTSVHVHVVDEKSWRAALGASGTRFGSILEPEQAVAKAIPVALERPVESGSAHAPMDWTAGLKETREIRILVTPRGVGLSLPSQEPRYLTHVRRRFMLLGQTLAGMQTWDIRAAIRAIRGSDDLNSLPWHLHASHEMTEVAVFASLFESGFTSIRLANEPRGDNEAPDFLNWSRILTPRHLLELARERSEVLVGRQ